MRRLLAVRRSTQVFGRGSITMLHPGNRKILAYLRERGDEAVLCVANLGRAAQPVELDLARFKGRVPVEMAGHTAFPPIGELPYLLTLPAHGFFWFRLATDVDAPDWHTRRLPAEDLAVLVLFDGWNSLFRDRVVPWRIAMAVKTREQFETRLLPAFLQRQRWFEPVPPGGASVPRAALAEHALLADGGHEWLLALVEPAASARATRWFVPLTLAWEDGDEERLRQLAPVALAKVRMQARVGVMADALADPAFAAAVVRAMRAGRELRSAQGTLRFVPTAGLTALAGPDDDLAATAGLTPVPQGRHSTVRVGPRLLLKVLRPLGAGPDAELEMGRFLVEKAGFAHVAAPAGSLQHVAADGSTSTLALLQAWVPHQGTAWQLAVGATGPRARPRRRQPGRGAGGHGRRLPGRGAPARAAHGRPARRAGAGPRRSGLRPRARHRRRPRHQNARQQQQVAALGVPELRWRHRGQPVDHVAEHAVEQRLERADGGREQRHRQDVAAQPDRAGPQEREEPLRWDGRHTVGIRVHQFFESTQHAGSPWG